MEKLAQKIKGKVVLVFGPSMVGKTTLALHLSKYFESPLYFRIDRNIDLEKIKKINENLKVIDVNSYNELLQQLDYKQLKNYDLVIVDSLTGLNEELEARYRPPKLYLELSRMQRQVIFRLSRVKPFVTSLIITHSRLEDFETRTIGPSINNKVLKHIDLVLQVYKDREGNRIVKLWAERKLPEKPEFKIEL